MDNGLAGGVCSDPAVARRYWEDPYVEKAVSLGLFRALHEGHQWLKAHAPQCTSPVAVLHGGADGLVDPRDSIEFFQEIGSEDKSLHIYAGLCHEIFNEFDKDLVIGDMLAWLDARASGRGFGPDPFDEAALADAFAAMDASAKEALFEEDSPRSMSRVGRGVRSACGACAAPPPGA